MNANGCIVLADGYAQVHKAHMLMSRHMLNRDEAARRQVVTPSGADADSAIDLAGPDVDDLTPSAVEYAVTLDEADGMIRTSGLKTRVE